MAPRKNRKKEFPAWQPEFRIAEDLPDIKAIRTDFLVNIGAVTLALFLVVWLAYREASINGLESDIETLRDAEKRLEGENMQVVSLNTRFMKRKRLFDDLARFYDSPFDVPRFLADIAQVRPAEIAFEEIAFQEVERVVDKKPERSYLLFFRGQTRSLKVIDEFKDALATLPYLENVDTAITEGANPRNPALNTFGFSIEVLLEPGEEEDEA